MIVSLIKFSVRMIVFVSLLTYFLPDFWKEVSQTMGQCAGIFLANLAKGGFSEVANSLWNSLLGK